jgi:hypothetical protein
MTGKNDKDAIREIERLLLKLAMLILLLIGLIRVIVPEIRSLRECLVGASVVNIQQGAGKAPR